MAYEFDIEQLQQYIEKLCAFHKEIKHGSTRRGFAWYQSMDHINDIKKAATKNIVVVAHMDGRRFGHKDDKMYAREIVLRFASYAPKNLEVSAAKKEAEATAERIMYDFMTRMEKQQEDDLDADAYGPMHFLRPESFSWEPIEDQPWLINHYGFDLTIPFHHYMPAHNEGQWFTEDEFWQDRDPEALYRYKRFPAEAPPASGLYIGTVDGGALRDDLFFNADAGTWHVAALDGEAIVATLIEYVAPNIHQFI